MATIQIPKTGVVTRKGQITIPVDVRKELNLHEGDKVEFVVEGDEIIVRRARSFAERTSGIFAEYRLERPLTIAEEREFFEQGVAEDAERIDFEWRNRMRSLIRTSCFAMSFKTIRINHRAAQSCLTRLRRESELF